MKRKLIAGPPQGRTSRSLYRLANGDQVDIYHVLLKALAEDPPAVCMDLADLKRRIVSIFHPGQTLPNNLTISNTLNHIQEILHQSGEMFQILEWREQELHVLDPYFLFSLRWSK